MLSYVRITAEASGLALMIIFYIVSLSSAYYLTNK
jgi:hypothetical protein